ncbi:MAG: hypothetical protein HY852_24615 [Bradyrhizobium sp.]|uniref:hypothetical protein n=1 Tax=Bradyrhizobium sp. TaxID=376 RepID=UPI0025C35043|nr:hypothetical protein [Bradyrhizobium sp.]MBI5264990.1 hypothetical protein [Bradyrhizobium sp.]
MTESEEKEDAAALESEKANLRLAHWPPPMRAKESDASQAKRKVKEPRRQLAHRRGTRLTRSLFTDLSDD